MVGNLRVLAAAGLVVGLLLGGAGSAAAQPQASGLWQGTVTVSEVSEPASGEREKLRPTASSFAFPVLIHVDSAGKARLLKSLVLLPTDEGYTLHVSEDAIARAARDAGPGARRLASAAYDFEGDAAPLAGRAAAGQTLTGKLVLAPDGASNPYWHAYHPDHGDPANGIGVERELSFRIEKVEGDVISGTYGETLRGLHKAPIRTGGSFALQRVSRTAKLED